MRSLIFVLLFSFAGCASSSWEDFRYEGEAETKKFALELRNIKNKEDLQKSLPKIKNRFNKIGDLLIKVHEFQKKGKLQEQKREEKRESSTASKELFQELARIYEIPGGRELIETCQNESIRKLDKVKNGAR